MFFISAWGGVVINELDLYINAQGAAQDFTPAGAAGNALLLSMFIGRRYSGVEFNIEQTGSDWDVYNVTNGVDNPIPAQPRRL